jgi:hypothetical protein
MQIEELLSSQKIEAKMRLVERLRKKMEKTKIESNCDTLKDNCDNNCVTITSNCNTIKDNYDTIEIPNPPSEIYDTPNESFLPPIAPEYITPVRADPKGIKPVKGVQNQGVKPTEGVQNLSLKEVENILTPEGLEIYKHFLPHPPPASDIHNLKICISKIFHDLFIYDDDYKSILNLLLVNYDQYIFAYTFACNLCII